MAKRSAGSDPDAILAVVIELLESRGVDGWQLREVADQLRMSLSTLYKFFPSRDELIVAAVERWMEQHSYRPLPPPSPEQSVFDVLREMFRLIFEPWEAHPGMLLVFIRACNMGGRERLRAQGFAAAAPLETFGTSLDPSMGADLEVILTNVAEGALTRYLNGDITVTEILPIFERTLIRLEQAANAAAPASARTKRRPRADVVSKRSTASRAR